jgi:hydroxymethylglutaryl-CoA reductase
MNFTKFPDIDFTALRSELKPETPARFGTMNAQQMIEHLTLVCGYAFSDTEIPVLTPADKLDKVKKVFLWSPGGFKQSVSNDFTKTLSFETKYKDMETAIDAFEAIHYQLADLLFNKVIENKNHPIFGLLNNEEWIQFFTKHTWHHFNQFSLVG